MQISRILYEDIAGPSVKRILGDFSPKDVVSGEVNPSEYTDVDIFADDYLLVELLSKFPNFDLGIDREAVALTKFLHSEQMCKEAGNRLMLLRRGLVPTSAPICAILHSARLKIAQLLGPFKWDSASQFFAFGPGASVGVPRRRSDSTYKFGCKNPTSTSGNAILACSAIAVSPTWVSQVTENSGEGPFYNLKVVDGNRVTTVPKNAKTDRVIAIEPLMNMYIQKGIGGLIRGKLKRVGINLDSQEKNQVLAQAGSLTSELATIDLSMASDCISLALCDELMPPDWMTAIKLCRSPIGVLPDGSKIYYRKVSSMGNGFTFELETLLFWALAKACLSYLNEQDQRLAVYGDDIIVPTAASELLLDVLSFVGFKPNLKKTFTSGPFRESCGKHYFLGVDVTPFRISDAVDTPARKIWLANSIARYASRRGGGRYRDSRFLRAYEKVIRALPQVCRRPEIPLFLREGETFSDVALGDDFDVVHPKRAPHFIDGFLCPVIMAFPVKVKLSGTGLLLKCLWSLEQQRDLDLLNAGSGVDRVEIPTTRVRHRAVKLFVKQWSDAGPWTDSL
jgi:hypothetical protein